MNPAEASTDAPWLVEDASALRRVIARAAAARRVAFDVEASGMHGYRARPCVAQIGWDGGRAIAIVDALATPLAPLAHLLGPEGPVKIVHDVAFDARLLAEQGVVLANVHDTAVAAQMLGRTATGLAALLGAGLGVAVDKSMQQHDWRTRPLDDAMIAYLAGDVRHLEELEAHLWDEVVSSGIEDAVLEETRYRLGCAVAAVRDPDPDPAYGRVKGADRLADAELAALRAVFPVREGEAEARDVPPHRVMSAEALVSFAKARPRTLADAIRIRGVPAVPSAAPFVEAMVRAAAAAPDRVPEAERARIHPPRPPVEVTRARRDRETRLLAWRRATAAERGVGEQVLLPGHCLKDAARPGVEALEDLAAIPGIGAFRVERDGEAILAALRGPEPPP